MEGRPVPGLVPALIGPTQKLKTLGGLTSRILYSLNQLIDRTCTTTQQELHQLIACFTAFEQELCGVLQEKNYDKDRSNHASYLADPTDQVNETMEHWKKLDKYMGRCVAIIVRFEREGLSRLAYNTIGPSHQGFAEQEIRQTTPGDIPGHNARLRRSRDFFYEFQNGKNESRIRAWTEHLSRVEQSHGQAILIVKPTHNTSLSTAAGPQSPRSKDQNHLKSSPVGASRVPEPTLTASNTVPTRKPPRVRLFSRISRSFMARFLGKPRSQQT